MTRKLLYSVEKTPGTSIEVFVSGEYETLIPEMINSLENNWNNKLKKDCVEQKSSSENELKEFDPTPYVDKKKNSISFLLEDVPTYSKYIETSSNSIVIFKAIQESRDRIVGFILYRYDFNTIFQFVEIWPETFKIIKHDICVKGRNLNLAVYVDDKNSIFGYNLSDGVSNEIT